MKESILIEESSEISKLLVIDDDEIHNESLSDLLEDQYLLEFATSGSIAKEKAVLFQPDLILLDIMLPDMSGYELCHYFKNEKLFSDTPIIFITGKMGLEDKVKGFNVGGSDYITKPFEMEEMVARVDTHLKLQSALRTINYYNQNLEQMLDNRTRELIKAEKHSAFSIMIKGIIHNLNSPLMGISLNIDTIRKKMQNIQMRLEETDSSENNIMKSLEDVLLYLDLTRRCSDNMEKILNVLITKSSYGRQEQKEMFDLNMLLTNEIKFMESNIAFKHNIKKDILLSKQSLQIHAIPADISQIFHNLINNAVDAVSGSETAQITIKTAGNEDNIYFSVSDNGPGIDDANLDKVFDPFFSTKADDTVIKDNSRSLGLGLYTCSEIIKSYKGRITVANNPDRGVTFTVNIPNYA